MPRQTLLALLAITLFTSPQIHAQNGDKKDATGIVQNEIWKEMDVPPAPILSPEEGLASIRVKDGFSIELVASEPLINDPVAITWDESGRIWAAEMWSYMPNADGDGEDGLLGRVVVLEDIDNDGTMDKSTVFLDGLKMPRALAIVEGGILIGDPPTLWYCQDLDGDLVCDKKTALIEYAARGDIEHSENGLVRGIDNWYYNSKSDRRFKFSEGKIIEEKTLFRGQWGLTFDDYGRIFYNTNSAWIITDSTPWENASNNPGHEPTIGFGKKLFEDNWSYSDRINPGVNRGYQINSLGKDHRLIKATAACGPVVYRGDKYPSEFYGNLFVPEPSIHSVARFTLKDDGLEVIAKQETESHQKWDKVEFLGSTDERFRPVNSYTGPDGNLYIVDMYRGIIQHRVFVTSFLRKQIIERGLDKPVGLGRIYRVVHDSNKTSENQPFLSEQSPLEWVENLEHKNGWQRDTAQRLLIQSAPHKEEVITALRGLLQSGNERAIIHSIWTLKEINKWTHQDLGSTRENSSDWVRTHALMASADLLNGPSSPSIPYFQSALNDPFLRVRLQAFSALRHINDASHIFKAWLSLDQVDKDNPYFIECFVSNSHGHEFELFTKLGETPSLSESKGTESALQNMIIALFNKEDEATILTLLNSIDINQKNNWHQKVLINSIERIAKSKSTKSLETLHKPLLITNLEKSPLEAHNKLASTIEGAFAWEGKPGRIKYALNKKELEQFEKGKEFYEKVCAMCHGLNGRGMPGLAPELDQSPWLVDDDETLILIVAQGLMGPIEVNGKTWDSIMPPHQNHPELNVDSFSTILTYVRNAWTNNAPPIPSAKVKRLLEKHQERTTPWTIEELSKLSNN